MSSEVYLDESTSSPKDEGGMSSLNSDVFSVNDHIYGGWPRGSHATRRSDRTPDQIIQATSAAVEALL